MKEKRFQRKVESFFCENCNKKIEGDGYTDHCNYCLFSKHVDINPGDRKSLCGGMMKPIGVKRKDDSFVIYYYCLKCGFRHRVKSSLDDNVEEIIRVSKKIINEKRGN